MGSTDLWVALRPAAAYRHLVKEDRGGKWMALRRPLSMVLVLASFGSLAMSGRLSLRLLVGCAECAVFLPILLVATLALVRGGKVRFARAIDLFFMGHVPWSLWLVALAAVWAFVPAVRAYEWLDYRWLWYAGAWAAFAWSCYIDFWFLRSVFDKTPLQALRDLLLQRSIAWIGAMAIFLGASGWQVVATRFGL